MYTLPTAPRTIGGVLDDAIGLYRATFKRCWLLALISGVFSAAVSVYQTAGLRTATTATTAQGWLALLQSVQATQRASHSRLLSLCSVILWLLIRAAIVARQHAAATGQEDSLGSALAVGLRRLPSAIGGGFALVCLLAIGFVLLVIPGIWLWGMFQVWFVALVVEQLGPFKALGRSWRLVEGNWWRASALVTVAVIIIVILSSAVGITSAWFGLAVSHGGIGVMLLAWQLVAAAINMITIPLLMAVMLSMYYDLKLRREGGDLAVRLSSLQPV